AKELKSRKDIRFYIVGDGLEKQILMNIVESERMDNIQFIPAILDKMELSKWYQKADLGVISLKKAELFDNVIPSKVFEYAGVNLPILYIGKGEGADLVNKFRLGRTVEPKTDDIINEILYMYDNIKYYREMIVERQHFIDRFRWKTL